MTRVLGWLTLFVVGTDLFILSPLLPTITQDLGITTAEGGLSVTIFALAYLVGGPALGSLADRRGRYALLIIALAVFSAANLATAYSSTLPMLLLTRAVAGLGASGITPSVYAIIGAAAPPKQQARWLAIVSTGLLLALATGAPAGALLGAVVSWRGAFVILTAAGLVVLALTALHWKRAAASAKLAAPMPDASATSAAPARPATVSLRRKLRAVSTTALWATAVYGFYTYLGTVLETESGFDVAQVSIALVLFGIGAVVGNLGGGSLADRLGGRRVSTVALLALAAATAAVAFSLHAPAWALLPLLATISLSAWPYFPAQQARLLAVFPAASGSLMAWNNSALYAGVLVGSSLGGLVLTHWGGQALLLTSTVMALLAAAVSTVNVPDRR